MHSERFVDPIGQMEAQRGGLVGLARASVASAWLQYRTFRFYPSNLVLAVIQQLTTVGVWYFVSVFLSPGADRVVIQYGGDYVAYMMVGVLLNQIGMAALSSPFNTVSEAFWDKRLETYRLSVQGIWANVIGRMVWQISFVSMIQGMVLATFLIFGGFRLPQAAIGWAVLTMVLLVLADAGIGLAGASLFFLLEVKAGQDPITWAYKYLIMIASGLYIPLTVLPHWLRGLGAVLPQTYGLGAERLLLLTQHSLPGMPIMLIHLLVATCLTMTIGSAMFGWALARAERQGGVGVVV